MNFTQLQCFVAVAETLSFTSASRRLNLVQSAVSSNISEMESELGVELFVRTNRYVQLTDIGALLLQNAYQILNLREDCFIKCASHRQGIIGHLTVGYVFSPTMRSILHLFKEFALEHPKVDIQLTSYPDGELARACIDNKADLLATCPNTVGGHLSVLYYSSLFSESYQVVMSPSHRLANEQLLHVEQLCEEDFCVMDRRINTGLYGDIQEMCRKARFSPHVVAEANSVTGLLLNIEMSKGLSILPTSWQQHVLDNGGFTFVKLEGPNTTRVVGLAWNKNSTNPTLRQFLKEKVEGK